MRLRSSLRCSKKVIAPAGSSAGVVICELDSGSGMDSGRMLVVMGSFLGICHRRGFGLGLARLLRSAWNRFDDRSEEHTSELQSRLHLVCRLLLEKKNGSEGPVDCDLNPVPRHEPGDEL